MIKNLSFKVTNNISNSKNKVGENSQFSIKLAVDKLINRQLPSTKNIL
jgi:hypothetical protein